MKKLRLCKDRHSCPPLLRELVDVGGFLRFLEDWIFHGFIDVMDSVIAINLKTPCTDSVLRELINQLRMKFQYRFTIQANGIFRSLPCH